MKDLRRLWILLFVLFPFVVNTALGQGAVSTLLLKQDTLRFSLQDAEKIMLEKNLDLIANHFNIDIAHAQTIAAKLWDNPGFSYEQNIGNPGHHDTRAIGIAEPILNDEPVCRVGVVGGPHLVGVMHHSQVYATAPARAAFNLQLRMPRSQLV